MQLRQWQLAIVINVSKLLIVQLLFILKLVYVRYKNQEVKYIHLVGTVNLNKRDYYGKTPLYWAAYKGHHHCITELLKFGADVNIPCRHGGTPLHAVVSLYPECVVILIKVR